MWVRWGWLSQTSPIPRSPDGDNKEEVEDNEENLNRDDVADVDKFYNNQILGDLFLGFEVKSEDGRSGFLVL